jgi:hypothetical protein
LVQVEVEDAVAWMGGARVRLVGVPPTCSCGQGFIDHRPGPGHYGSCLLAGSKRTLSAAEEDLRWERANASRFKSERDAAEAVIVELRAALIECVSVLGYIAASGEGQSYRDMSIKAQATANALLDRIGAPLGGG